MSLTLSEQRYNICHGASIIDDRSKVGLLKSFPEADKRLVLFEADIYDPDAFEHAIKGCEFVFHVATPLQHNKGSDQVNLSLHLFIFDINFNFI
jgi:hypothetical protein